jgi:hypothetical protein
MCWECLIETAVISAGALIDRDSKKIVFGAVTIGLTSDRRTLLDMEASPDL